MNRLQVAQRANVPPFYVMDLLAAAQKRAETHGDLCNLVAGQPSTGAPKPVREEAKRLLDRELLGYTTATGIAPLREAIARHHRDRSGIEVSAEDVVVTTGSSGGFLLAFLSAFEAGDRVVLARPGYPCYRNVLTALGIEVVEIDCGPETRFQPTLAQLQEIEGPIHGLVIASPANPTGTMIDPDQLAQIAAWCGATGVRLISDEIYHGITFPEPGAADPRGVTAVELDPNAIVINSFSKYWGMTGWRLGWAILPEDLVAPLEALASNFALSPPAPAQELAMSAFTPETYAERDGVVAGFARARQLILDAAPALNWGVAAPSDGAFYYYSELGPQLARFGTATAYAQTLLEEADVALVPGVDFDPVAGDRAVRISYAAGEAAVAEALTRILAFQAR